jgi:hypothetical protein
MRRTAALLAVVVAAGLLAGCAPARATSLPEGVTVSVQQNRDDYGPRRLEVLVANGTSEALEVQQARLDSPAFSEPAVSSSAATVRPGTTTALRLELGPPDCDGVDAVEATVRLDFSTSEGSGGASVVPGDPLGTLARVHGEDCLAERVASVVEIAPASSIEVVDDGGVAVAHLRVVVTPTGGEGAVTIDSIDRTILLRPASGDDTWPVGARLDASSEPLVIDLAIVPSNCSTHTVSEDKRGTFLPVALALDGGASGVVAVGVEDAVRGSLYDYIAHDFCGW